MLAPRVNDSNHLRARATEMRASSKELKDNNAAAVIMRLADLYDRLADRVVSPARAFAVVETRNAPSGRVNKSADWKK